MVLAEYDGAYVDGTFGSAFDVGMAKVDVQKMASLVSRTADALASLAFSSSPSADARTNETHDDDASSSLSALHALVSANLPDFGSVERTTRELAECLIDPNVGFECALAKRLFEPKETFPSRYAGVAPTAIGNRDFDGETDGKVGAGADDVARFVFEFLAEATAEIQSESASSCASPDACGDGEVCARSSGDVPGDVPGDEGDGDDDGAVRHEPRRALLGSDAFGGGGGGGAGMCVATSARFLPALSGGVFFDDDENGWTVSDADADADDDENEDPDPLWCESDWPVSIGARVFHEASATNEWIATLAGAAVTFLAALFANELDAIAKTRFKEE